MQRREFIGVVTGAAAWPLAARAQRPTMPVIGYLGTGSVPSRLAAFRKGLDEQGFAEPCNLRIEFAASDQYEGLAALAAGLVRQRVAVIFTDGSSNAAQAARSATATIPIVFAMGADPVRMGLVASLKRPGGNLTGVTFLGTELGPKRLELLRELVRPGSTIAFLANPTALGAQLNITNVQAAARSVGQDMIVVTADTANEIEMAFATMDRHRAGGLLVANDGPFVRQRDHIVALAARYRIPAIYFSPEFPAAGGLMSYSDDRPESYRQAGAYVGRVLKGENPADLPVIQPTRFALIINLKTASAMGLVVPPKLRALATEVIE